MASDRYHRIALEMSVDGRGKIFLDGVEVKGFRGVEIKTGYNQATEVKLTMIANVTATIDGAQVEEVTE